MITDDPHTPDPGCWEINISYNTELKPDEKEMETPLLDINYGFNEHTQLRLEVPYLFTREDEEDEGWQGRLGHVSPGIKYRFLDEDRAGIAMSIYPQMAISTESGVKNEYIFPVELEKNFGNLTIGTDVRYVYINGEHDFIEHGILTGFNASERLELMAEFVYRIDAHSFDEAEGVVNFGMKYELNHHFSLLSSLGTGIFQSGTDKPFLISFTGIQINF